MPFQGARLGSKTPQKVERASGLGCLSSLIRATQTQDGRNRGLDFAVSGGGGRLGLARSIVIREEVLGTQYMECQWIFN